MNQAELLVQLIELAEAAGLRVRPIRGTGAAEGELTRASSPCSVVGKRPLSMR